MDKSGKTVLEICLLFVLVFWRRHHRDANCNQTKPATGYRKTHVLRQYHLPYIHCTADYKTSIVKFIHSNLANFENSLSVS